MNQVPCCPRHEQEDSTGRLIPDARIKFEMRREKVMEMWKDAIRRSGRVVFLVGEYEPGPCVIHHYGRHVTDWSWIDNKIEISMFLPGDVDITDLSLFRISIPSLRFFAQMEVHGQRLLHFRDFGIYRHATALGRIDMEKSKAGFVEKIELDVDTVDRTHV